MHWFPGPQRFLVVDSKNPGRSTPHTALGGSPPQFTWAGNGGQSEISNVLPPRDVLCHPVADLRVMKGFDNATTMHGFTG